MPQTQTMTFDEKLAIDSGRKGFTIRGRSRGRHWLSEFSTVYF